MKDLKDYADIADSLNSLLDFLDAGGTFPPESHEGEEFRNDQGLLPLREPGYYHRYTIPTEGVDGPGRRRLVRGNDGDTYYTNDHYDSFTPFKRDTDDTQSTGSDAPGTLGCGPENPRKGYLLDTGSGTQWIPTKPQPDLDKHF